MNLALFATEVQRVTNIHSCISNSLSKPGLLLSASLWAPYQALSRAEWRYGRHAELIAANHLQWNMKECN